MFRCQLCFISSIAFPFEEDGWVMEKGFSLSLSPSQHIIMRHEETHTHRVHPIRNKKRRDKDTLRPSP